MTDDLLSQDGVAMRYQISRATLFRWVRDGCLPRADLQIGRRKYWRWETLIRFEKRAARRR